MQMEGLPENNTVLIAGKIVKGCVFSHEVYGEGFYTFQISSERLSDKEDILPVTVSERLIDMNLLQVGTKVDIIGQLRSYNNYNSKKNPACPASGTRPRSGWPFSSFPCRRRKRERISIRFI